MSENQTPVAQVSPNTMVHLNVNLDANDIVAIKVAKIENHCIATEQALQEEMKKLIDEKVILNRKIETIIDDEGEKLWRAKAEKMAVALSEFESCKIDVKIMTQFDDYNSGRNGQDEICSEIHFMQKGSKTMFVHFRKTALCPKQVKLLKESIKKIDTDIIAVTDKLQKCRNAMSKISTLERHCRAQLATKRLQELGREDILKTLDDVQIPGMPNIKLALPSPK